jgi:hypothetical protein
MYKKKCKYVQGVEKWNNCIFLQNEEVGRYLLSVNLSFRAP